MSVDCLTALLKDIDDIKPLGLLLEFKENMVQAIQNYYGIGKKTLICRHLMNMWLLSCTQDPVQQLKVALNELKQSTISQLLLRLTSIGNFKG